MSFTIHTKALLPQNAIADALNISCSWFKEIWLQI